MSRLHRFVIVLALGACRAAPTAPPASTAVAAPPVVASPAPGRADVDPMPAAPPLTEMIVTGHEPCATPRAPIDDSPARGHALIAKAASPCRTIIRHRSPGTVY
jgi:hypothetical protein